MMYHTSIFWAQETKGPGFVVWGTQTLHLCLSLSLSPSPSLTS